MDMHQPMEQPGTCRTYVVKLAADDGRRVYCYVCAASPERAKVLACRAELAPLTAVRSVRVSDFEEGGR